MTPSPFKQSSHLRVDREMEKSQALSKMQAKSEQQRTDQFRKTKMCRFHETGRCRYADTCPFAHSIDELEEPPDLSKSSICKSWQQGRCMMSPEQCPFAHGKEDLRKRSAFENRKKAAMQQELSEGSETTACYSDGSGTSRSGPEDKRPSFSDNEQLKWDPIGIADNQAAKGFYGFCEHAWNGEHFRSPGRGRTSAKNKKTRSLRTALDVSMSSIVTGAFSCFDPLELKPDLVPTAVGPNQFVMMPASGAVMLAPSPYIQQDLEEMLKQAQPDHYED